VSYEEDKNGSAYAFLMNQLTARPQDRKTAILQDCKTARLNGFFLPLRHYAFLP